MPGRIFPYNKGALALGMVRVPSLGQKLSHVGNLEAALEGRQSMEPNCAQFSASYSLSDWLNFCALPCLDLLNPSTKPGMMVQIFKASLWEEEVGESL